MAELWDWFLIVGLVLAFNITPIFAPPTVALLAYFQVTRGMDPLSLALVAGTSATVGKLTLSYLSRPLGDRFIPANKRASIDALAEVVRSRRSLGLSYLAIFVIGPIPKGALFTAVGLARISPIPGAIVFGITRTGFYYVSLLAIDTAATSLAGILDFSLAGIAGIIIQILGLIAVIVAFRLDFGKLLGRFPRVQSTVERLTSKMHSTLDRE